MPNNITTDVSFNFNEETGNLERTTVKTTVEETVEVLDITGLDGSVQNLKEQIGGFEQAKVQAQGEADAHKADMDNKIADTQKKVDDLVATKTAAYADVPDLADKLTAVMDKAQEAVIK